MSYSVSLRHQDLRLTDNRQVLLRLGTDSDVDQTIKGSLGHYFGYASVLSELGLPGGGALTLSVYLLESGRSPIEFRTGPFQNAYRTTTVEHISKAGIPIWATDVSVEGQPLPNSADHFDLVVTTDSEVLPDAYSAAGKAERRRLRGLLRPHFDKALDLFDPPRPFDPAGSPPS